LKHKSEAKSAFNKFLQSLHYNINNSITQEQAVEMLAQHLITQPIFEALFEGYSFVKNNPISHAMNEIVAAFSVFGFNKDKKSLNLSMIQLSFVLLESIMRRLNKNYRNIV
jgi:Predicted helicase